MERSDQEKGYLKGQSEAAHSGHNLEWAAACGGDGRGGLGKKQLRRGLLGKTRVKLFEEGNLDRTTMVIGL